jgi:hypothetical protein
MQRARQSWMSATDFILLRVVLQLVVDEPLLPGIQKPTERPESRDPSVDCAQSARRCDQLLICRGTLLEPYRAGRFLLVIIRLCFPVYVYPPDLDNIPVNRDSVNPLGIDLHLMATTVPAALCPHLITYTDASVREICARNGLPNLAALLSPWASAIERGANSVPITSRPVTCGLSVGLK